MAKEKNKVLRIDLRTKSPSEVADFLAALLAARRQLTDKGFNIEAKKFLPKPAVLNKSSTAC